MNNPLEKTVGELLQARGLTLAIAESCTGGLVGHLLTNVPGSSRYFLGGVIAYSSDVTEQILRVSHETVERFGLVSEQMALEMARGVRGVFHAALGLSVIGIAGPGGGSAATPVGLTYIGLSSHETHICRRLIFGKDREGNKYAAAGAALEILHLYLADSKAV